MNITDISDHFESFSLHQQAECLCILVGLGFKDFSQLVNWADAQIKVQEEPPYPVIELALAKEDRFDDAIAIIRNMPGESDPRIIAAISVRHCREAFLNQVSDMRDTIERCKSICQWLNFPQTVWYEIDSIDDRRLLAEQGIWDDGSTRQSLIDFLDKYSATAAWQIDKIE